MFRLNHVGWSGGDHEGYHVGDYFAAANVDAETIYSTERGASRRSNVDKAGGDFRIVGYLLQLRLDERLFWRAVPHRGTADTEHERREDAIAALRFLEQPS